MHLPRKEYSPKTVTIFTTKELLLRQSQGKFLTHAEKELIKKYAESQRKKRLK